MPSCYSQMPNKSLWCINKIRSRLLNVHHSLVLLSSASAHTQNEWTKIEPMHLLKEHIFVWVNVWQYTKNHPMVHKITFQMCVKCWLIYCLCFIYLPMTNGTSLIYCCLLYDIIVIHALSAFCLVSKLSITENEV